MFNTTLLHYSEQHQNPITVVQSSIIPNISVDCVIFAYDKGLLKVLVRKEFIPTAKGVELRYKLPGNHMLFNERMEDTASRTLLEQTGARDIFMSQFSVFSDLDRLMRNADEYSWIKNNGLIHERVVTIGFYSLIKLNQPKKIKLIDRAEWKNVDEAFDLIFDHKDILNAALKQLRIDMLLHPIIFELLPQKFTLGQLQHLFEIILDQKFDKRNFRRKISGMKFLVATEEWQEGVAHKPAQLYRFDKRLYNKHKKENFEFII